jgi:hypothetical protein
VSVLEDKPDEFVSSKQRVVFRSDATANQASCSDEYRHFAQRYSKQPLELSGPGAALLPTVAFGNSVEAGGALLCAQLVLPGIGPQVRRHSESYPAVAFSLGRSGESTQVPPRDSASRQFLEASRESRRGTHECVRVSAQTVWLTTWRTHSCVPRRHFCRRMVSSRHG